MSKKPQRDAERARKERERKKCKHCERPESEGFSLWDMNEPFIKKFIKVKDLKIGELVACPLCGSKWFKNFHVRMEPRESVSLDFISEESLGELEAWNSRNLIPTTAQIKVLKKIKATPPDAYTNGSDYIRFPCKCVLKDGRTIDFCVIQFQQKPPDVYYQEEPPIYIDQVKEILPSEYTLSPRVRYATTQAQEIRMSYAPTTIKLPGGGYWTLNWTNHFFGTKKIKGKDIVETVSRYDLDSASESETGEFLDTRETIIYADWMDELLAYELDETSV